MARQRITATDLAKMLNATLQPVYVLDDEMFVVFFNRGCLQWLGQAAGGLLGRQCRYHSAPEVTGPDAVAAGLCPPPEVMECQKVTATVSRSSGGQPVRRRATFIPLGTSAKDLIGIVAILDPVDLDSDIRADFDAEAVSPDEEDSAGLHERVRRFHDEAADRYRVDRLIGDSPAMRRARAQIELSADSRASVLLVGPPGSGCQHAAAAIHYAAYGQSEGSLIPLDCAALGADVIRSNVLALAGGEVLGEYTLESTLVLSHVDQLPADVQGELWLVLFGKRFPLRVIATAERPLHELAQSGEYRADLAAALGTITIELPPLTQRREDLPLLAQLFLEEANSRSAGQLSGFSAEALDVLDAYGWPGNVDELAQTIAAAHRAAAGPEIGAEDLPQRIHLAASAAKVLQRVEETIVLDEFLGQIERELIRRALSRAKGNKAKAARLLGMTRPRLYRRLVQLGFEKD